jgi:hypothetical protein
MSSYRCDRDESVFDNPLMTPPSTNAETGTWDDEGPIRGFEIRPTGRAALHDLVIEDEWTANGLQCLLIRVTEYFVRGRHTQDSPDYGEGETYYRGYVHAPGVESFPKGYCGVYIVDCYPDDGWFVWGERSWSNRPGCRESMRESARRKTETLAKGLAKRSNGEL